MWTSADLSEFIISYLDNIGAGVTIKPVNLWQQALIILGISVGLLYYCTKVDPKVTKLLSKFSGPRSLPIIGNIFHFAVPAHELMGAMKSVFDHGDGKLSLFWIFRDPHLLVTDPIAIEKILSSNVNIEKMPEYKYLGPWLGSGLLLSQGSKWHSRRKLLTPAFHFKILEEFNEIFNEQSQVFVEILNEKVNPGEAFNMYPYITRCALDIICETAMGEKIHAQQNSELEYTKAVNEMTELFVLRFKWPWMRSELFWTLTRYRNKEKQLLRILHGFTEEVIRRRQVERKLALNVNENQDSNVYGKKRQAFLDLLLAASDDGRILSDSDIREETDTFMFEGHDTTSATLNFTIYLLASNPGCQEKVREELYAIFGEDRNRVITTGDVSRMKYLECCIKESLRLFPAIPFFGRNLQHNLDLGDDRIVPKCTILIIPTFFVHRDFKTFTEPERFLPERFATEFETDSNTRRHPYAYIPFSAGPRNCIGQKFALMEMKVVLAQFFRNFRVETALKMEDIQLVPNVVLRPKNDIMVSITKLNTQS